MKTDPISGKTLLFTFDDGPMAGKTMEHRFASDGSVTFRQAGDQAQPAKGTKAAAGKAEKPIKYEVAKVSADVHAVSYLSSSGYTLTSVLDFKTGALVAFASNEKELVAQRGSFEAAKRGR